MNRRIYYLLLTLLVLIFFSGFFWFYETKYLVGRASITQYSFSVENSYVFVSPLRAKANGEEKIRVTVFILNNQGLGVVGKKVVVGTLPFLTVEAVQALTDGFGKAIFDISSGKPGDYYLEVKVDGTALPQKASLNFTE